MNKLQVKSAAYNYITEIRIGKRTLAMSERYLRETFGDKCRFAVVTDDTVLDYYGEKMLKALGETDASNVYVLPSGESAKRIDYVVNICQFLSEREFTRSDVVIGLGGGVVCDMTGFAASIYLRRIECALIPTTLLAMCDASIGGKTAVDTAFGKNLIGSFYPAGLILNDTSTLSTLDDAQFSDGCAEVIKTAYAAFNAGYGDALLKMCDDIKANLENIITFCSIIKGAFVREDLFDENKRMLLNFGHTIGHAVEFLSDYSITHGHAVAIGMAAAARASVRMQLCKPETRDRLLSLLNKYTLPYECNFTAEQIFEAAKSDKKRRGNNISIVVLRDRGLDCRATDEAGLMKFIKEGIK